MSLKCIFFIPAAGKGTRLSPLTDNYCKPSIPIKVNSAGKITRMIEIPLHISQVLGSMAIVTASYKKEKLEFIRRRKNIIFITLKDPDFNTALTKCENIIKASGAQILCYLPADTLVPVSVVKDMINSIDDTMLAVLLCTREQRDHNLRKRNKRGFLSRENFEVELCGDLGVYVININRFYKEKVKSSNFDIVKCWEMGKAESLVKIHIPSPDIPYVDIGTPLTLWEVIRKLNKENIDKNGNILFPGAYIHESSKNVIALPNSNSLNIPLSNCIIPEERVVTSAKEVLHIPFVKRDYFDNSTICNL